MLQPAAKRESPPIVGNDDAELGFISVDRYADAAGMRVLECVDDSLMDHQAKALFARLREREAWWIHLDDDRRFPFDG